MFFFYFVSAGVFQNTQAINQNYSVAIIRVEYIHCGIWISMKTFYLKLEQNELNI